MRKPLFVMFTLCLAAGLMAVPGDASAQMRAFEQSMGRLNVKLKTFDGTNLNITTFEQLTEAANFAKNYKASLQTAIGAWNSLIKSAKTQARHKALSEKDAYFKALAAALQEKAKTIKPPVKVEKKPDKVIALKDVYVGPDVAGDKPWILDTFGKEETIIRAWGSPGTKSKPSRWSAWLKFWVGFKDIANGDMISVQVYLGKKKLGKAHPCKPTVVMADVKLAYFECKTPKDRDWDGLFKTAGVHTLKLTYKKPIEGVTFKDFAVLQLNAKQLKKGASNNPALAWDTDHDMKLTVTTVEEALSSSGRGPTGHAEAAFAAAFRKGISHLRIRTWFKREKRLESTSMTCLYKGKRVAEGRPIGGHNFDYWSYVKKGSPKRDDAKWVQAVYEVGMLKPRPGPGGQKGSWTTEPHWLHENPGEYKCVIVGDGDVIKEIYFTVGEDGAMVKPQCQLQSMNTLTTVTLARTVDKKLSDRKYDKKAGKKYGFHGRVMWPKGCPPQ